MSIFLHDPEATYQLIPSGWEGTVRDNLGRYHHPCHMDCPAEARRCMVDRELWPCATVISGDSA